MSAPTFYFATCPAGHEAWLKADVLRRYEGALRPAFMRPGLITFKVQRPLEFGDLPESAFATVIGESLGRGETTAALLPLLGESPSALHVFRRQPWQAEQGEDSDLLALRRQCAELPLKLSPQSPWIADVIVGDVGEPLMFGRHRSGLPAHPVAGALPELSLPAHAPSRAWLKMRQALAWLELGESQLQGLSALELGSAPGGASLALLEMGMNVIGVDSAAMHPLVLGHPKFQHLRLSAGAVGPKELPMRVDLLCCDMNLHPGVSLRYCRKLCRLLQPRWTIFTLKINDDSVASEIGQWVDSISSWAPARIHARTLPANRREITVVSALPQS